MATEIECKCRCSPCVCLLVRNQAHWLELRTPIETCPVFPGDTRIVDGLKALKKATEQKYVLNTTWEGETMIPVRKFLTSRQVRFFIESFEDGKIFSVLFEKKDGTLRRMICRQHVTSHLKGKKCDACVGTGFVVDANTCPECHGAGLVEAEPTYNGKQGDKDNIGVFDTEANEYRCFPASKVVSMRGGGAEITSGHDLDEEKVVNARGEEIKKK